MGEPAEAAPRIVDDYADARAEGTGLALKLQSIYTAVVEPMRRLVSTDAFRAGWVPSERAYMVTETLLAEAGQGRTHMIWRALHWSEETMKEHEAMGFHDGWGAAAAQLEALAKSL